MEFETMERCGRIHVVKNGVESEGFTVPGAGGCWLIYRPIRHGFASSSLEGALIVIASRMDTWHTASQAAARLVEMDVFDGPPSAQRVTKWCRDGLFPGALKLLGRGARGSGGSWRIPGTALPIFAERRKEQ